MGATCVHAKFDTHPPVQLKPEAPQCGRHAAVHRFRFDRERTEEIFLGEARVAFTHVFRPPLCLRRVACQRMRHRGDHRDEDVRAW